MLEFDCHLSHVQLFENRITFDFKFGTCHGQFCFTETSIDILIIINDKKGNGDFLKCLRYFENEAATRSLSLRFIDFLDDRLLHFLVKRGYQQSITSDDEICCAISFFCPFEEPIQAIDLYFDYPIWYFDYRIWCFFQSRLMK